MRRHWKEAKQKRWHGPFWGLPLAVLNSRAYLTLSPHAVKLLNDLGAQYHGNNNGDLCAAWKIMCRRNWRSEATLMKAKRELLQNGLIVETRKGARPNKASLYGLTFYLLDPCGGKLDINPNAFPFGEFIVMERLPPLHELQAIKRENDTRKNATLTTPAVVETTG